MSEWRWYVDLMRQRDCILGNVGQQGEYQNKTSNRSIISVSWHQALRRHALETGALISLCTGLKSALNSDHSHLHSRFPKSVLILFSGKWDVGSGSPSAGPEPAASTSLGELVRDACSQPTPESETLGVRSAIPVLTWPLGGFTLHGKSTVVGHV